MQHNSTGVASVSMEEFTSGCLATTRMLHSNDGFRPNTSYLTGNIPVGPEGLLHGVALLFHMCMKFEPHNKDTNRPPRPVTEIAFFLHVDDARTSQEGHRGLLQV
jgi:hypothetical protein